MTGELRVEDALRESEKRATFLAEASRVLASSLDYEKTLRNVADLAVPEVADWCAVDLVEEGAIRRVAVAHPDPAKVELVHRLQEQYPPDPSASVGAGHVVRTGESEFASEIPDEIYEAAAVDEEYLRILKSLALHSYVIAPLRSHEHILGAITLVYAESDRRYNEGDIVFVEDLARRAATAIENARLVREIEEAREHSQEQAVELEAQAAELEAQAVELEEQAVEMETINEELSAAEGRLRGIIDSALDAIVTTDTDSVITDWNRHAEMLFGWTAEEAIGKNLGDTIIPPRHQDGHRLGVERYLKTGDGPILNRRTELTALNREGREFPIELTVAATHAGSRVLFSAFIRDLTDRHIAERRIAAEHAVTRVLAESHTLDEAAPRSSRRSVRP